MTRDYALVGIGVTMALLGFLAALEGSLPGFAAGLGTALIALLLLGARASQKQKGKTDAQTETCPRCGSQRCAAERKVRLEILDGEHEAP